MISRKALKRHIAHAHRSGHPKQSDMDPAALELVVDVVYLLMQSAADDGYARGLESGSHDEMLGR